MLLERPRFADPTPLLEREEPLAALAAALAEVRESSSGRLVLVRGEAGIGKTALLRAFRETVPPAVRVLSAGCDPLTAPRPLGPLLDLAHGTDDELRARIEDE